MREKGRGLCTAQPAWRGPGEGERRTVTPHLEVPQQGSMWSNGKIRQDEISVSAVGDPGTLYGSKPSPPTIWQKAYVQALSLLRCSSRLQRAPSSGGAKSQGTQQLPKPALLPTAGWQEELPNTEAACGCTEDELSVSRDDAPGLSVPGHGPVSSQE